MSRILAAALLLIPFASFAAPGDGGGGGGGSTGGAVPIEPRRLENDYRGQTVEGQRQEDQGFQISGVVRDTAGSPLSGIVVKMFTNGVIKANARTDVDGSFEIHANPMSGGNNTTDLWFQSPDLEKYLDTNVILAQGRVAREEGLFAACTARVNLLGSFVEVEVTMMSQDERKDALVESKCLETDRR